jgi:hypothetical protein
MESQPPSDEDAALQPLIDYLQQHREQINLEALRKELITAGHPPELVDEALKRIEPNAVRPSAWPFGLFIMLMNLVSMLLFVCPVSWFAMLTIQNSSAFGWFFMALVLVLLIGEIVVGMRFTNGPRDDLGRALIWGASATLVGSIVLTILACGVCSIFLRGL